MTSIFAGFSGVPMMMDLPADLLAALPSGSGTAVAAWWSALGAAAQPQVAMLWDERVEILFFEP